MNDENLHKKASDFIEDEGFISWVRNEDTLVAGQWEEWIRNHPDLKEEISKARNFIESLKIDESDNLQFVENKVWDKIKSSINSNQSKPQIKTRQIRRYISIAAIAASIILPLFIFLGDSNLIIRATTGEQLTYHFPDQSGAKLNSGSSLEFNPVKWHDQREVVLRGEAFFEVEKGESFDVITNNGTVTVLGTSFNVFSRGNKFEVACLTGKVEVRTKEHTLVLNPGDAVSLNHLTRRLEKTDDLNDEKVDWLEGEYKFEDEELLEVFAEMERQFNVNINIDRSVAGARFTGSFDTVNLDTALYQVCWPMSLEVEKIKNKYLIKNSVEE